MTALFLETWNSIVSEILNNPEKGDVESFAATLPNQTWIRISILLHNKDEVPALARINKAGKVAFIVLPDNSRSPWIKRRTRAGKFKEKERREAARNAIILAEPVVLHGTPIAPPPTTERGSGPDWDSVRVSFTETSWRVTAPKKRMSFTKALFLFLIAGTAMIALVAIKASVFGHTTPKKNVAMHTATTAYRKKNAAKPLPEIVIEQPLANARPNPGVQVQDLGTGASDARSDASSDSFGTSPVTKLIGDHLTMTLNGCRHEIGGLIACPGSVLSTADTTYNFAFKSGSSAVDSAGNKIESDGIDVEFGRGWQTDLSPNHAVKFIVKFRDGEALRGSHMHLDLSLRWKGGYGVVPIDGILVS